MESEEYSGLHCRRQRGICYEDDKRDLDFRSHTIRINKSYQRLEGKDVITDPKTPKSNRIIVMPDFLSEELESYLSMLYGLKENDRIYNRK